MSIPETIEFDNTGRPIRNPVFRRVFVPLVVLLVGLLGYGLGRLDRGRARPPVEVRYESGVISNQSPISNDQTSYSKIENSKIESYASVYASSKGTKYYYESCKSSISPANKVSFASAALAEAAGYTLAAGCKRPE